MPSPIYFDHRWNGSHGIGRFSLELQQRLPNVVPLQIIGPKLSPIDPLAITWALTGKRKGCFFSPGFNAPLHSPLPMVFTIHDLVHLHVPQESTALRRLYYSTVVRPATHRARRIFTVSEHSRTEIVEWSGIDSSKVLVVGNGVSPVFTSVEGGGRERRRPFFLHVGRRAGHKNVANLLRGFAASRARRSFTVVFTGDPDDATMTVAAAYGLSDRVRFAGPVDDLALRDLYREAYALVFPSVHEGFGLPIVEAMGTGTPVITSNTTSMPEVAGEGNALFIDPLDCESIAAAIDRLVDDGLLWDALASRGPLRASTFTWGNVAARVTAALAPFTEAA